MWKWTEWTYSSISRTLKHDYNDSMSEMVTNEIWLRFSLFFKMIFGYGVISVVNAILIRVAIKSSVLIIFPILGIIDFFYFIQGRGSSNWEDYRSFIYQQMGSTGA